MSPGTTYGIGAKSSVDTDPFNTWSLITAFQAPSPNVEFSGIASASTRFYNAVNLDAYAGPLVSIVSPAAGTTVSNDVQLQVRVTDVLPLRSVNVYVGGILTGTIQAGQNGTITLPTRWFPNGQHEIWVEVVNAGVPIDTDGDTVVDDDYVFQAWASVTANFSNQLYMQNYSPLYSAPGSITLQYAAASSQDYTFEVFKTNGTLLHTASGQSLSGGIALQWDFKDLSSNSVNDGVYIFSLTSGAPSTGTNKIVTTNFVDSGVSVGKYVISYGTWPNNTYNEQLAGMNAGVSVRVNWAAFEYDDIIGMGCYDYKDVHPDYSSDPFPIWHATQTNDLTALTNALKKPITGSWLFDGHASSNLLIPGHDKNLTVRLTAQQVAAVLGNNYTFLGGAFSVTYGRRLFSTFLTGCSAATGASQFPTATGSPTGVQQVGNNQINKTAFVGFARPSYQGSIKMDWITRIHLVWLDADEYNTPLSLAVALANNAYPSVQGWGPTLIGYPPLQYNANESR